MLFLVIPAKTGMQYSHIVTLSWTPASAGETTFYEIINVDLGKM